MAKLSFSGTTPVQMAKKIVKAYRDEIPANIKRQGLKWIDNSFKSQGFTDNGFTPWKPRKNERHRVFLGTRNKFANNARESRGILIGSSSKLRRGNQAVIMPGKVRFFNKTVYAQIHNEGGRAGRKMASLIPRRRFMGKSAMLGADIKKSIVQIINKSFRQ